MVLSLFGESLHLHHFATEQDIAEEFFILLSEARELYLQDVIVDGKRYDRYMDDFINRHRYIDCNHAVCRNCHEMNIHIVKGLLTGYAHLIKPLFTAESFSFEECMELKRMYDTSESPSKIVEHRADEPISNPPLSFGCNFTREQMADIVSCANTYHLFNIPVCVEDMEALFACKEGFCLRVNTVRYVAILFDALLENTFIQSHWQSVLNRGRFLRSKDDTRFVSASSLSSALSAARNNMTSAAYGIRKAIGKLKR
ncbi:MAG: hypothetical protein LUH63_12090 [Parabacteroides sp.]|nr:hypothetical protein [Parabacteroides sp.]